MSFRLYFFFDFGRMKSRDKKIFSGDKRDKKNVFRNGFRGFEFGLYDW